MTSNRIRRSLALAALAAAVSLAGCSENQDTLFDEFIMRPSSAPFLVDPPNGATAISPLPTIEIRFEDVISYSNVNNQSVRLLDLGADLMTPTGVAVAITPTPDGRGFFLEPIAQLVAPRTHEIRIDARAFNIRFADGNDIDDFNSRFTTGGDPFLVTTSPLPGALISAGFYQTQIVAQGGAGTNTFSVTQGTLPPGLVLDQPSGRIFGSPTTAGTFVFTITVTDSIGRTGSRPYSLTVSP